MQCQRCFFDNPADARWCGYCGADLSGGTVTPAPDPGRSARKNVTMLGVQPLDPDDPFRAAAGGRGGAAAPVAPEPAPRRTPPPPMPEPPATPRRKRHNATLVDVSPLTVTAEVVGALIVLPQDGAPRALLLRAGRTRIGRDPDCDVVLDDPRASGAHAILRVEGGRAWILDTSSNGTGVSGHRLAADRADVQDGTIIEIGTTALVLQLLDSDTLGILRGAGR